MRLIKLIFLFFSVSTLTFSQNIILNQNGEGSFNTSSAIATQLNTSTSGSATVVTLTSSNIAAADQIWVVHPNSNFPLGVITALKQGLDDGKRIVIVAEWESLNPDANSRIRLILNELGVSSELGAMDLFLLCRNQEVIIGNSLLTDGVSSPMVLGASTNAILMGGAAVSLIKATELGTTYDLVVAENVSNGQVVIFGDSDIITNFCNDFGFPFLPANETLLSNIVSSPITSKPVPTVSEWGIIIMGLLILIIGIIALKRQNRYQVILSKI